MTVLELLSDPKRWTKRVTARDKDGNPTPSGYPDAVCWCLVGAILKCYPDRIGEIVNKVNQVILSKGHRNLVNFNDTATHEDVLEVAREANI